MSKALAIVYLPLITKVSYRYWKEMPVPAKSVIDLEDVIAEVCYQVVRRQSRYKKERGAESTFVQTIAQNVCRSLLQSLRMKKRRAKAILSLSDLSASLPTPNDGLRWLMHGQPMELILEEATDHLRRSFAAFLQQRSMRWFSPQDLDELRRLARKHSLTYADLRTVLVQC